MARERLGHLHIGPCQVLGRIKGGSADARVQHGIGLEADLLRAGLQLDVGDSGRNACRELRTALGVSPGRHRKAGRQGQGTSKK